MIRKRSMNQTSLLTYLGPNYHMGRGLIKSNLPAGKTHSIGSNQIEFVFVISKFEQIFR